MSDSIVRKQVRVAGVVQGVGFRPFVLRLASHLELAGFVGNDSAGVFAEVQGEPAVLAQFLHRLIVEAPAMASIEQIDVAELEVDPVATASAPGSTSFHIVGSRNAQGPPTLIPPDVGVCDECMAEVRQPSDRRFRYPFTNCTNCGPRFTIIRRLPYDRSSTTMAGFAWCEACAAEYGDPSDRRFHAQPIACPICGPQLKFLRGADAIEGTDSVLAAFQASLARDEVAAVKGVGGYHLACVAASDEAVSRLRARKGRGQKAFAVMVPDVATAHRLAELGSAEIGALASAARPVVLCRRRPDAPVSSWVAPGNPLIGIMLPYSPLHHLLFDPVPGSDVRPPASIVLTSGNVADERICFDDTDAIERLGALADTFVVHDRPIHAPCDDSVVRVVGGDVVPIRRSRGFAPVPIRLPVVVRPALGYGGELKATFCLAAGSHAWVSPHIGDLGNFETERALMDQAASFCAMFGVDPEVHAVDRHPGYRTHRLSLDGAWSGRVEVQHHHAHVASVMVEHGLDGSSPVIGFAFDGTGYGTDHAGSPQIWGGEVLVADYHGFDRVGHLAPLPLPGGDGAVRNPCRVAVAYLAALGVAMDGTTASEAACDDVERNLVVRQVERGVGCQVTTSMGRLFDAVASLLGIRHRVTYEAQAAIELEAVADRGRPTVPLSFEIDDHGIIDPAPVLEGLISGLAGAQAVPDLACSFHHAVAEAIGGSAARIAETTGRLPVALTGGVFQNVLLTRLAARALTSSGFEVLTHGVVPPNDGGLSLGQAVIAGCRRA